MWPSFMNGWWWCSLQIPLENDVRLVTTIWVILVQYLCAWNLCYMYYIYISITTMFLWFILGTSDGFHGTTHRVSGYNTRSLIVNYNAYRVWRIVSATKCYFSSLINFPSFHTLPVVVKHRCLCYPITPSIVYIFNTVEIVLGLKNMQYLPLNVKQP